MRSAISCALILALSGCAPVSKSAGLVDVSALDRPPKLLSHYPVPVDRYSGPVRQAIVTITILEDGRVESVSLEQATSPEIGNAALEIARKWRFEPPKSKGLPARVRMKTPITWSLTET